MITKLIQLKAKPGMSAELNSLVKSLIEPSRNEVGCIKYDAYSDDSDPSSIYLIEEWESTETLNNHKLSTHFLNFKDAGPKLIEEKGSIALDPL
jgi:quinol monooxygenase YgiN